MYKVGDEVFVKGKIAEVIKDVPYPIKVKVCCTTVPLLFTEEELITVRKTYEEGLADAWELANKVGSLEGDERVKIFDHSDAYHFGWFLDNYTPEQALAKIEAYEKEKEIEVGDVVEVEEGINALVIDEATENTCFIFTENGCVEEWHKKYLKKTGKKISIGDLLRQIGE